MKDERTDFGFARTVCACGNCRAYCFALPGYLIPSDLEIIGRHLGYDDLMTFAMENLLASPGATVMAMGKFFQIFTLVPNRREDGACRFLTCDFTQKMAGGGSKRWRVVYGKPTIYRKR